jgi:hypothetical protein
MPRRGYGPSENPRLRYYLKTIDLFASAMRLRVKTSCPRNWAVFWRVWSDEQLIQRHQQMNLLPKADHYASRGQDWQPPTAPQGMI